MPRFAANLSLLYAEHPFLDRFAAAAADGFAGIELQFPYEFPAGEIRSRLAEHGLTLALFNMPPGNMAAGDRGMPSIPGREAEFLRTVDAALDYARVLGTTRLHAMAGRIGPDEAHSICAEVGAPNLMVQMDFYHCQIVEGDLSTKHAKYVSNVGHIQIAGVPERHEPDIGEVNYPHLFRLIDELQYGGWVGCEYRPRRGTREGLGWFAPWRARQAHAV
jgi:hydroxypyruvate isomerase